MGGPSLAHTRPHLSSARRGSSAHSAALTQTSSLAHYINHYGAAAGSHAAALEQRAPRVLRPLGRADPELGALAHDVCQHGAAQEHQVLAPRRVQHAQPQALQPGRIALRGRQRLLMTQRSATAAPLSCCVHFITGGNRLLSSQGHAAATVTCSA